MNTDKQVLFQVWDVETTMNDTNPTRSLSNPFHPDNHIVLLGIGVMLEDETFISQTYLDKTLKCTTQPDASGSMIVGHNIKFDLHYMRPYIGDEGTKQLMNKCPIWDTQIAEYILSGQRNKMSSLDDLCAKYGFPVKGVLHAAITNLFDNGFGADHADPEALDAYLKHDLEMTGRVALKQMAEATEQQFSLIAQMGETLKAVQEMEWNGMHIDKTLISYNKIALTMEMVTLQRDNERLLRALSTDAEDMLKHKPNALSSNQILSAIIFGGIIAYVKKVDDGLYKTGKKKGQIKFKNYEKTIIFPQLVDPDGITEATKVKTKHGSIVYMMDEAVLEKLGAVFVSRGVAYDLLKGILKLKKMVKVKGTYYDNFEEMNIDSVIHHTIHQTTTTTGRTSSAKPNMQNVPVPGDNPLLNVRSVLNSRYDDGVIVEIDFKQLEVCVLAWLTRDPHLIHDIIAGRDIHTEIGKDLGYSAYSKSTRRDIKTIVFAMIYGAGAKGIAKDSGIDIAVVRNVIEAFYTRYNTIQNFYKDMTRDVEIHGARMDLITRGKKGPEHMFEWTSPTGRKYMFNQDPFRPGPKYTQLRNYPVQGTATGDIVPMVVAEVASVLRNAGYPHGVKLITTTHDSVTLDCCDKNIAVHAVHTLQAEIFSKIVPLINEKFPGIAWDIPLTIEVEIGPNWGDMKPLDKEHYT